METQTRLRIGELSKRSGVSTELLRAWERRYGLLQPTRSSGGLRLYTLEDLERVQRMRRYLAEGLAAAEAAALAVREAAPETPHPVLLPEPAQRELAAALDSFDEPAAQGVIDDLLASATVDAFLTEIVLPYLHELGERWQRKEASVAQEHFASAVLRGRMLGLARGWGRGLGPLALLACPPGERHEFGLIAFGLALRGRGWRITYLGGDTPVDTLERAARSLDPALIVLSVTTDEPLRAVAPAVRRLARERQVAIGGDAAAQASGMRLGTLTLGGDPVSAADDVTERVRSAALTPA
jgi:DNA-binding transcriptional MerR regulator